MDQQTDQPTGVPQPAQPQAQPQPLPQAAPPQPPAPDTFAPVAPVGAATGNAEIPATAQATPLPGSISDQMSALDAAQAQIPGGAVDLSIPAAQTPPVQAVNAVIPPPAEPAMVPPQEKVESISDSPQPKPASSFKQLLVFVAIFIVLFALAALIGYAIGFQQGQAG